MVYVFSLLLGLLIYWLLGFVVNDIGSWRGPDYARVEERMLDQEIVQEETSLKTDISNTSQAIQDHQQRQQVLRDSTDNTERTMNQLLEIQRLTLEKGLALSDTEQRALARSEELFLENQDRYQQINEEVARLTEQLHQRQSRQREVAQRLVELRKPVRDEYSSLRRKHDFRVAFFKLLVLVPLLAVAVFLFLRRRGTLHTPFIYAFGIATLLKVILVMHQHFPRQYFKYVLILAALALVVRILLFLLRMITSPKPEWLLKQHREAYERFLCPVCAFPIRRGPLKFLSWGRRGVRQLAASIPSAGDTEGAYVCPACSTQLFEECSECHAIRHSLLPACERCGSGRTPPRARAPHARTSKRTRAPVPETR